MQSSNGLVGMERSLRKKSEMDIESIDGFRGGPEGRYKRR